MVMQTSRVDTCQQTSGNISHISFDSRDLTGEEKIVTLDVLQGWAQKLRRSDEGIAVHLSITQKFGVLQPRDEAQDAFLFRVFQVGLEAHEIVKAANKVILPELDDRVGSFARAWILESDGAHRTKGQRIDSALGDDLNRQAAFEEVTCFDALFDGFFE